MRTLYIVRHAKSSWADASMDDAARPLNERGRHDAPMMAKRFADLQEPVGLLASSPAVRARSTADAFASALGLPVQENVRLYLATADELLALVQGLPDEVRSAMIVGHNPGLSVLVDDLTGDGMGDMPTCAMARVDLEADHWNEVARKTGSLVWSDMPKD
jgi:phosphohistidine phosphatase